MAMGVDNVGNDSARYIENISSLLNWKHLVTCEAAPNYLEERVFIEIIWKQLVGIGSKICGMQLASALVS